MTDSRIYDTRDMALTHKDFFRILPRAMGEHTYSIEGHSVSALVSGGTVRIELGSQQLRKIALMEVPWCRVEFIAENISETDFKAFSEHFHRYFQRGGG